MLGAFERVDEASSWVEGSLHRGYLVDSHACRVVDGAHGGVEACDQHLLPTASQYFHWNFSFTQVMDQHYPNHDLELYDDFQSRERVKLPLDVDHMVESAYHDKDLVHQGRVRVPSRVDPCSRRARGDQATCATGREEVYVHHRSVVAWEASADVGLYMVHGELHASSRRDDPP